MGLVQTGGARVGRSFWWSINWTLPFATLEVDEQALTLRIPRAVYQVPRADVRRIRLIGPSWAPPGFHGVVVEHNIDQMPPYIVFWTLNRPALLQALAASGYQVAG